MSQAGKSITSGRLSRCELFDGLDQEEIDRVTAQAQSVPFPANERVFSQGDMGDRLYVILTGRAKLVAADRDSEKVLGFLSPGNHFGELGLLQNGKHNASAVTITNCELLVIERESFQRFMETIPSFAANISRALGKWLRGAVIERLQRHKLLRLAVVRSCEVTGCLAWHIARIWHRATEPVQVITDRLEFWHRQLADDTSLDVPCQPWDPAAHDARTQLDHHLHLGNEIDSKFLVDISSSVDVEVLEPCEKIWWAALDDDEATANGADSISVWRDPSPERIEVVRFCDGHRQGESAADSRVLRSFGRTSSNQVRVLVTEGEAGAARLRFGDLARLKHRLRGIRMGLALGGGGAKGLAHLGVLKAFEEEGIYFDQIAGTSAGALIGVHYAAGLTIEEMLREFHASMQPPPAMKWLPNSKRRYLLALFRFGLLDRIFRKTLGDLRLEELLVPTSTTAVDLISGREVVRAEGDCVHAILESINHPHCGSPIFRDGQALVDGGILINVPSLVLRRQGCDIVVAVDVGSRLRAEFAGNTSATRANVMNRPGLFETLLRISDVQQKNLAAMHASESDFLIRPDTSAFPFEDFTQGNELFRISYAAARRALPEMVRQLDSMLGGAREADEERQIEDKSWMIPPS